MATRTRRTSGIGLAEIAARTGVSLMTVSRALRGVGRVDPATRDRVWTAARDLGYRRAGDVVFSSPMARGRSGRDLRIVLPMLGERDLLGGSFGIAHYQAITARLADIGGSLTVRRVPTIEAAAELFTETRANGILLRQQLPRAWLQRLVELAPVAVASPFDFACGVDTVYTSEPRAAALAVDHLVGLGHRSITCFGIIDHHHPDDFAEHLFSQDITSDRMSNSNQYHRYAAWQSLCAPIPGLTGGPAMHLLLAPRDWRDQGIDAVIEQGLERILAMVPRPTAVIVATDPMGAAFQRACARRGLGIPADLSLVTYGSIVLPGETTGFTTIIQPIAEQGRVAVEMLQRRIARPDSLPLSIQLEPALRPAASTAAPSASPR